ncbi:MAG TPA: transglutaminaseTgpA domain-containing protein [Acidimicrobiales bacterium]|nr:transglutaminaseTgpA domain-containing protein [Acidimicrobiales bacterium]
MTTAVAGGEVRVRAFPLTAIGEVAFALVGVATVFGLRRVFVGGDWFGPLLLHVLAAHGTVALLRRRRVPALPALLLAAAVGVVVISWLHAGETTTFGLPTFDTIDALRSSMSDAFGQFSDVKAPTEPLDGFLVACAAAVWASAIAGDWAAFRADATVEAVLPAAALFGVAAVLGGDVDRIVVTGVWIAAVLAFVLVRRAERLGRVATWVGDHRARGPRTLVALGIGLALLATVVAAVVGPRLPGAEAEAVVSLTDLGDDDPGTRFTISPLIDIQARLVNQPDLELFTVRSDVRSYWRLTSLDKFDGARWTSNGSYGRADGGLDEGVPVASERITFDQEVRVSALAQIWLPAAYEPRAIQAAQDVRYDEVSGTLIVDTDIPSADGMAYAVRSALPQHDPAALATASTEIPEDVAELYLGLPEGFSPEVQSLATSVTAGSTSTYDAALRLQQFFRDNFTYELDVALEHSIGDMETFLFQVRAGYCEQFAGTYAAMARSIGIPSRVAVGFTPGVPDAEDPTLYHVRGEHAHAWPELYLGEYGWVAFEPTPGRGAPFAEQYTGVPEQQAQSGGGPNSATTTSTVPATPDPSPATSTPDQRIPNLPDELGADPGTGDAEPRPNPWPGRIAVAAGAVLAVAVLYVVAVLAVGAVRRWARRRRAGTPEAQVALAWEESLDAARRAGVGVRASATQSQAADEIAQRLPVVEAPIRELAATVEATAFAPVPPEPEAGAQALALADRVTHDTRSTMSAKERFRTRFDPRRLRPRG